MKSTRELSVAYYTSAPRILTVGRGTWRSVPMIRMRGEWLRTADFEIGDRVKVEVENGKLTVSRIPD
jgi:hypothetical protein